MTLFTALASLPVAIAWLPPAALRLLPGGIVASLLLAVTLVLAAAVAGLMAYHYAQARIRERRGFTFDPVTNTVAEEPEGAAAVRARSAEEIGQIRARIESLMSEQNLRVETQSQHLAQKLDDIRMHMDAQDRHVDGLKSELRHEIVRRDGELDDLRGQLATALDAFWKTLPEGAGDARALPPAAASSEASPAAPEYASAPAVSADLAPVSASAPAYAEPQTVAPAPAWSVAATLAPASAPPPAATPATPVVLDSPSPAWTDASDLAAAAAPPLAQASTPAPIVSPAAAAVGAGDGSSAAPPDADDLTIIRGIDADTQRKLYAAGIFHLDEVARWSRADARRIAGAVGVAEETIMHEWIFEAQSVLFDSYQRQMSSGQSVAV